MTQERPITPPPELVEQWKDEWENFTTCGSNRLAYVSTAAARWGADQELEACCAWLLDSAPWTVDPDERPEWIDSLRADRRPKPPSLKEQALDRCNDYMDPDGIIRRALESLPD